MRFFASFAFVVILIILWTIFIALKGTMAARFPTLSTK
jgi:hypothetical protein